MINKNCNRWISKMQYTTMPARKIYTLYGIILFLVLFIVILLTRNSCDELPPDPELLMPKAPIIYAVTPTFYRPVQKAELTRLSHLFMLVPNLHWIVIEDAIIPSVLVEGVLRRAGLENRTTHLNIQTPKNFKLSGKDPHWSLPRGVEQRNLALTWLRDHFQNYQYEHSLLYFMDDDNTYSHELFSEINKIPAGKVGVWPVGLVGGLMVEKPLVDNEGQVTGFNSAWHPERPFPIDMAGFAIAVDLLLSHRDAKFGYDVERGYQESEILRHLTTRTELLPLANKCTEVLVWHTRTEETKLVAEKKLKVPSNKNIEV